MITLNTQDLKKEDIKWYKKQIRTSVSYELEGGNKNKLGRINFTIKHFPPRMFKLIFFDNVGKVYNGEVFFMKYTKKEGKEQTATSRVPNGKVPYTFFCITFNKKLSFETRCGDSIDRDLKDINVTYNLPCGNLRCEATTIFRLPYSDQWQSLD